MRVHFIAVVVCAFALQGCSLLGIETCGMGSTRCHGNTVQTCKIGLGWTDSTSCEDLAAAEGGQWTCAAPKGVCSEVHQCMPAPSRTERPSQEVGDTSEKTTKKPDKPDKTKKPEKKE
jgi:hypothetical protein